MIIFVGTVIFFTIRLGGFSLIFIYVYTWKLILKGAFKKDLSKKGEGEITTFQPLTLPLSVTKENDKIFLE